MTEINDKIVKILSLNKEFIEIDLDSTNFKIYKNHGLIKEIK